MKNAVSLLLQLALWTGAAAAHEMLEIALQEVQEHHATVQRYLQGDEPFQGDTGAANPDTICASYEASGLLSCDCRRSGSLDVFAECDNLNMQCASDNSTCLQVSFSTIFAASSGLTSRTTTCVDRITALGTTTSCVEVQPEKPGFYNETVRCGATISDKVCSSCSMCNTGVSGSSISIDCCNIEADAKMTCGVVNSAGLSVLSFDAPGTHGDCSAAPGFYHRGTFLAVALAVWLWGR